MFDPISACGQPAKASRWREEPDADNPLYKEDNFRMYCLKVLPCSKRYCHDWTTCPFAHAAEKAKRRDPRIFNYTGVACQETKRNQVCPRGDQCPFAHNVFEYWLHHSRYRTQLCNDGVGCKRKICFFAHTLDELRVSSVKVAPSPDEDPLNPFAPSPLSATSGGGARSARAAGGAKPGLSMAHSLPASALSGGGDGAFGAGLFGSGGGISRMPTMPTSLGGGGGMGGVDSLAGGLAGLADQLQLAALLQAHQEQQQQQAAAAAAVAAGLLGADDSGAANNAAQLDQLVQLMALAQQGGLGGAGAGGDALQQLLVQQLLAQQQQQQKQQQAAAATLALLQMQQQMAAMQLLGQQQQQQSNSAASQADPFAAASSTHGFMPRQGGHTSPAPYTANGSGVHHGRHSSAGGGGGGWGVPAASGPQQQPLSARMLPLGPSALTAAMAEQQQAAAVGGDGYAGSDAATQCMDANMEELARQLSSLSNSTSPVAGMATSSAFAAASGSPSGAAPGCGVIPGAAADDGAAAHSLPPSSARSYCGLTGTMMQGLEAAGVAAASAAELGGGGPRPPLQTGRTPRYSFDACPRPSANGSERSCFTSMMGVVGGGCGGVLGGGAARAYSGASGDLLMGNGLTSPRSTAGASSALSGRRSGAGCGGVGILGSHTSPVSTSALGDGYTTATAASYLSNSLNSSRDGDGVIGSAEGLVASATAAAAASGPLQQ